MPHRRREPLEPFTELKHFRIDPRSVQLLKHAYCLQHYVVVLGEVDPTREDPVTVGMLDPDDGDLVRELALSLGRPVRPVRLNAFEVRKAIEAGYLTAEGDGSLTRLSLRPVRKLTFTPSAGITQIVSEVLARAVSLGASDVHIETYEDDVDVRFRIDGILHHLATPFSKDNIAAVISRLKVLAHLDIAERRVAQDGRIRARFEEKKAPRHIDFRLSIVPGPHGEDAVLRVLDGGRALIGLEALGFGDRDRRRFEELIANPEGLLLVTGPTGSGKTTTLYAAVPSLATQSRKLLTVEDPIEYHFPKVNQKQVSASMGFAAYARAFMRQNPDVILIGEIRDEETADVAFRAAQTGHLVLSTLHTNDAVRTVSRLRTLGIDANLLSGSLLGAVSQRLVRRLCECRMEVPPSARERERLFLPADETRWFGPRGCASCRFTGFHGRVGVYELFVVDDELADLIAERAPVHQIRRRALAQGMTSLLDDALAKAAAGMTSLAEIERVVPYRIIAGDRELRAPAATGP